VLVQAARAEGTTGAKDEGHPWMRLLLAYAARKQAVSGNFDTATALARMLAGLAPESSEAAETFWWLGWYHGYKQRPETAAGHYEELARHFPTHYRADDALSEAASLWRKAGKPLEADKAALALCTAFPDSPYVPGAYYGLAKANPKDAQAYLELAAASGFGDFFGHRAMARIARADTEYGRPITIGASADTTQLRTAALNETHASTWDARLDGDVRIERLRFFGAHGLEAGRWESLAIAASIDEDHPDPLPYYRALAEAGYMHTAVRYADSRKHLTPDERRLILYPLAYWPQARDIAADAGVDPFLMLAIARQESTFRASIRSRAGATGVMQLMPATADWLAGVDAAISDEHAANLGSPDNSLRMGAAYLQRMLERSNGSLVYALASYNAGPGNCDKWRARYPDYDAEAFIEAIPFSETKDYVKKVLGNYAAYHSLYRSGG
jgi:soluble lytic murein transglycosylase